MRAHIVAALLLAGSVSSSAQIYSNSSLVGRYYARHIEFTTDANNLVIDARSITGTFTFSGTGTWSFNGQQVVITNPAASFTATGTYNVSAGAIVSLSNPQKPSLSINARLSTEALIGSSTEATDNTFDIFAAIPAPASPMLNNASIKANFFATDFELLNATTSQVRNSLVPLSFDGAGNIPGFQLRGHGANVGSGADQNQTVNGSTYSIAPDGTGSISFPLPAGLTSGNAMLSATQRNLYVSQSGNVILGATPGAHDLLIGVKALATSASNATLAGRSWLAGIRVDSAGTSASYTGSETVIGMDTAVIEGERYHGTGFNAYNLTAARSFTVASDGSGSVGPSNMALGTNATRVGANIAPQLDPTGYEITFAVPIPAVFGSGVFVNPQGVVNAASNAPAGDAISPGEFIAIYGSGLSPQTLTATPPYPNSLGGVAVTIGGLPAPVYLVSAQQINCLVPYGVDTTKTVATVSVTNNNSLSNTVTVPLAKTSPGIFSNDTSGTGFGAILHLDNTLVTPASPAHKGEILVAYLTGLGALQKSIPDGTAPNPPAADSAIAQVVVWVNGIQAAAPGYAGINPVYPGLYQINFTVPATLAVSGNLPLALQTSDAFHDQINLPVQ